MVWLFAFFQNRGSLLVTPKLYAKAEGEIVTARGSVSDRDFREKMAILVRDQK